MSNARVNSSLVPPPVAATLAAHEARPVTRTPTVADPDDEELGTTEQRYEQDGADGRLPRLVVADSALVAEVTAEVPLTDAFGGALPSTAPYGPHRTLRWRLIAIDTVSVLLCWALLGFVLAAAPSIAARLAPGVAASAATLLAISASGLYRSRVCARGADELGRLASASFLGALIYVLVQWQSRSLGPEVLACAVACTVVTACARRQFARWLRACRVQGRFARFVVLVGANEDAGRLRTMLRTEPDLGYVVTAVVDPHANDGALPDIPSSGSLSDLPALAKATGAGGVVIVPFALSSAETQCAMDAGLAAGLHVEVWPAFRGVGCRRLRVVPVAGEAVFYVEPRCGAGWELAIKRAIDLAGAVVGLALAAPLLVVAAVLIKIDSPGPLLHRGQRVGLHGRPFVAYKLRTMRTDDCVGSVALAAMNERTDGPLFKASTDPRVTKVGRVLRSSSIDEIPQLWNVLVGTMSLVGPRPALPGEVAAFDEEFLRRHSVRPGITGLWQVQARRNPSFHAYRRLDLSYVDNWSLLLDLSILAATVPSVVSQALGELRRPGIGGV